jgi:hypothetical protein
MHGALWWMDGLDQVFLKVLQMDENFGWKVMDVIIVAWIQK